MTRIAFMMASASALISLAACGPKAETTIANAENTMAVEVPAAPVLTPGQTFANTAASSDAFEIATSNLAAEKSQSASIKKFAAQMVKAHTDSTAKLLAAASGATPAIVPDATLTADQQSRLAALQAKSGAEFDTAYAAEQVAAHQATLDALRAYGGNGDVPQLKDFAAKLTPTVAAHLNMAKSLKP